ncbi:cupin domain-containing protein [Virgibacillus sp. 179-BFC.A HS]|uniref:Cupin domain-containing protein n=1 Tax=Tigheibacillus jepli TaxID=3035914 RepID=A0ABU5CLU5_9BACI|nr:cupin domain-containing protein [Virgibacillus sp. 179-BFC.A HS]MDY0406435.1 cupin domain-containing protein [Virgibacillus sp. 179-BFC.A HS]
MVFYPFFPGYPFHHHYPYHTAPIYHGGHWGRPPIYHHFGYPFGWRYDETPDDLLPDDAKRQRDHGNQPFVVNIEEETEGNNTFRTALWTGKHLQVTLMSIPVGEDIGLEVHPDVDQFLRIEEGQGFVQMGPTQNNLDFERDVDDDDAIMVPAGTWHNVTNTGNKPLKLYSIYAPPNHPFGTVHETKADAEAAEGHYSH